MDNTLHELIEQLGQLRTEKARLNMLLGQTEKLIAAKERDIIAAMDDQQITESKSAAGKVSLGQSVYPQVKDWEAFHQWILENSYLHFLERRAVVRAYREALEQGITVPGVLPFTKRKITFREV